MGAALLKADMSHLETWPDYFEADMTYMPHAWDFQDFAEAFVKLTESRSHCLGVAVAGQDRYLESLGDAGGERFADHIARLAEAAVAAL